MRLVQAALAAVLAIGRSPAPGPPPQATTLVTDQDAYAIYAKVIPEAWDFKEILLIQQETERLPPSPFCTTPISTDNPEWEAVLSNLRRDSTEVRHLTPTLTTGDRPYRFISRATIEADDARLALKYPGMWQRRPESIDYAAVSVVGFDWSRTKALVYVRTRSSGNYLPLTLRDGKWVRADLSACGWIA